MAFVAFVSALYFGRPFLVPIVIALLVWLLLRPLVRFMNDKLRLPVPLAAAITLFALAGALGSAVGALVEPAKEWVDKAPSIIQQVESKANVLKRKIGNMRKATDTLDSLAEVAERDGAKPQVQVSVRPQAISARLLAGTQSFIVDAFSIWVLVFFLLSSGDMFLRKMVRVSSGLRNKIRIVEIANDVEQEVGRYLLSVAVINVGLGIAVAVAMHFLKMPNPLLWGAMVAVLNFIPYVGALISLTVLGIVALITFPSPSEAMVVPAVFLAITTIEGQVIQPMVVGRRSSINPVLILVALMFWGWLWGVAGVLVAVPMLVVSKVICAHVDELSTIHEFLDGESDSKKNLTKEEGEKT